MDRTFVRRKRINFLIFSLTAVCALVALSVLFFILGYIAYHGFSSLSWNFLTKLPKPVGEQGGGIANAIVGTAKLVGLAGLLGIPVGVLGAVYLAEYGNNRTGFAIRYCADILNGVPSIVVGVFAYTLIVLPMKRFSALAGSAALAIILIPVVLRTTEEFIRLVPGAIREAALALGVPQWKVILFVVLPTASRGIITGILLALSRIAGETAPLIFTAFGNRFWDNGLLNPIASLPHTIFTYAIAPYEDWHRQAWAAALILLLVVLTGNVAARWINRTHGI
ncbi:MAG: phosphate ABC transporter, permease protein PstA [Elusimicrobia bacterium RIFCSPHIGHO2_02_FULL_57_9]|nr:MAG: phosphate ABC transporter, permease protein PstA [Elusimicrobia bacterium RIFCSPHIGHO2_02_FULL_57_9]